MDSLAVHLRRGFFLFFLSRLQHALLYYLSSIYAQLRSEFLLFRYVLLTTSVDMRSGAEMGRMRETLSAGGEMFMLASKK